MSLFAIGILSVGVACLCKLFCITFSGVHTSYHVLSRVLFAQGNHVAVNKLTESEVPSVPVPTLDVSSSLGAESVSVEVPTVQLTTSTSDSDEVDSS